MSELFKKGQIVPRRIGHIKCHKKVRHMITFGADVRVSGNVFTVLQGTGQYLFKCGLLGRKRNNGTFQKTGLDIENVQCVFEGSESGFALVEDESL